MESICVKCGKSEDEVHPVGKINDPFFVGICCSCGGDVYRPMTTAVCYFTELDVFRHKNQRRFMKSLEKAIEDLYSNYKKVYFGRLPNATIYYISTATLPEVMEFFQS